MTDNMLVDVVCEEQHECCRSHNMTALITGGVLNKRSIKRTWRKREVAQYDGVYD